MKKNKGDKIHKITNRNLLLDRMILLFKRNVIIGRKWLLRLYLFISLVSSNELFEDKEKIYFGVYFRLGYRLSRG